LSVGHFPKLSDACSSAGHALKLSHGIVFPLHLGSLGAHAHEFLVLLGRIHCLKSRGPKKVLQCTAALI